MGNCQNVPDDDNKRASIKNRGKPQAIIKTYTWPRDSHGLFDYESKTLSKKSLKTSTSGKIIRDGNEIHLTKDLDQPPKKTEKDLIKLQIKDGNFWVGPCVEPKNKKNDKDDNGEEDWDTIDQSVWLVVKSYKANAANRQGYKLTEGDLIKLGRVKFRIREMKGTPTISTNKNANKSDKQTKNEEAIGSLNDSVNKSLRAEQSFKDSVTGASVSCRICLSEYPEPGNPFFSPCNCAGTMKYVHVKCLNKWLKSKLHVKTTGHATSIYWKNLECELCKKQFPNILECDNKKYDLIEIEKPDCAYIILDILSKDKNVVRGVHVIKMETKTNIRLGRGHDSDIRITDISVSRCHALIKLDKGNFYIEDNNSKFGTLVHFKKPFPIFGDFNNISIQVGRTVVALTVKKNWKILPACFSQSGDVNTSGDEKISESGEESEEHDDGSPVADQRGDQRGNEHRNTNILGNNNGEENHHDSADDLSEDGNLSANEHEPEHEGDVPNEQQVNSPNQNN